MEILSILLAISAVILLLIVLEILGFYIAKVFSVSEDIQSGMYQGGELLRAGERGYRSKVFDLPVYFLILHVIGFFTATLYILPNEGFNFLNWTVILFGIVITYTVFLIRQVTK